MDRPEPPENVRRGDEALEAGEPEKAQALYLRQVALALTDLAAISTHVHEVHSEDHHVNDAH